jgi:hypothetical protein
MVRFIHATQLISRSLNASAVAAGVKPSDGVGLE